MIWGYPHFRYFRKPPYLFETFWTFAVSHWFQLPCFTQDFLAAYHTWCTLHLLLLTKPILEIESQIILSVEWRQKLPTPPLADKQQNHSREPKSSLLWGYYIRSQWNFPTKKTAKHITPRLDTAECLLQFSPSHLRWRASSFGRTAMANAAEVLGLQSLPESKFNANWTIDIYGDPQGWDPHSHTPVLQKEPLYRRMTCQVTASAASLGGIIQWFYSTNSVVYNVSYLSIHVKKYI